MTKAELTPLIGKYVQIVFTLYSKKSKATGYFDIPCHITTVEDKNIEIKDNYNHILIVPIARIKTVELYEEPRRTEEEWQIRLIKDVNKTRETIRKKKLEIEEKEPLITLNY
jgi:hypothetical protein